MIDDKNNDLFTRLTSKAVMDASNASRTFAHRTLAHHWYFIDACQVNRPFQDLRLYFSRPVFQGKWSFWPYTVCFVVLFL